MKLSVNSQQKNIIGSQIRCLRLSRNLTQGQVAARLQLQGYNFTELIILRIEKGQRLVTDIELKILCQFFEVTPDTLLGFEKPEHPQP
ncbi:MAG: helix-turn-helix domain-containing protein [Enterocloster sp.]